MSRVIHTDGAGKQRTRLSREVVLSIRELMKQTQPDGVSRDQTAFIALALQEIGGAIDISVDAWEKRGYWVKADRFRMEWAWSGQLGKTMEEAVLSDDWPTVAATAIKVAQKLMAIKIPEHHRLGTPWVGAWEALNKKKLTKLH
ncbi:MAG TPA: hypothetical protein VF326_11310 [Anaerolineaceae bacterium]